MIQKIVFFILFIIILFYFIKNFYNFYNNNKFLVSNCNKVNCYPSLQKCTVTNGFIYNKNKKDGIIDRKTYKCIINPKYKFKLINLDNIFVPSIMNGTFCDIVFTTYYDYYDFSVLKNRINNLNFPLPKCIRIRKYKFQPGIYFEIKYPGGTKIRTLIDDDYNILDTNSIDEEYKAMITSILDKIKLNKIQPIFNNTYKRMSFIYKNNPSIRITIDSNIEFFHKNLYNLLDKDVIEFKIPNNIGIEQTQLMIGEISKLSDVKLEITDFSKFEYYYYKVILNQK